jgi:uncharacterized membrane protein YfcA
LVALEALGVVALLLVVVVLFSPIGLGGGLLYVPILHYLVGLPFETAILGSLVLVLCTALGSAQAHRTEQLVDMNCVKLAVMTALPAAVVGSLTSIWVIEQVSDVTVKVIALSLTSWVLYQTIRRMGNDSERTEGELESKTYQIGTGIGGFACGMLGIGGGSIYVTMNRGWGGLGVRQAAGTSFTIASMVVPVAIATHSIARGLGELADIETILLILTPVFALALAYLGGKYSVKHLPVNVITWTFIIMVNMSLLRYLTDLISA